MLFLVYVSVDLGKHNLVELTFSQYFKLVCFWVKSTTNSKWCIYLVLLFDELGEKYIDIILIILFVDDSHEGIKANSKARISNQLSLFEEKWCTRHYQV